MPREYDFLKQSTPDSKPKEKKEAPELDFEQWKEAIGDRTLEIVSTGEKALINVAGASASGKGMSTELLGKYLESKGLRVLTFSTDDFYKGIAQMMVEKLIGKVDQVEHDLRHITAIVRGVIEDCPFGEKFSDENMAIIQEKLRERYPHYDEKAITAILQDEFSHIDFDNPDAVNLERVNAVMLDLINDPEKEVALPKYSMFTGEDVPQEAIKQQGRDFDVFLVEGIYGLNDKAIEGIPRQNEIRTFIDADEKTLVMRRSRRDIIGKRSSMPPETNIFVMLEVVMPAYKKHIFPDREKADLILRNDFTEAEAKDTTDYDVQDKLALDESAVPEIEQALGKPEMVFNQEDYYFTNESDDGNDPEHLIRVRVADGKLSSLVHKSKLEKRDDGKIIRPTEEYVKDGEFGQHYENIESLTRAFENAGFRLATKIVKERQKFVRGDVEVMLDRVSDLGVFLELRTNNQRTASPEIDHFKEEFKLSGFKSVGPYFDEYFKKQETERPKQKEVELKFKLKSIPEGLSEGSEIEQTYFDIENENVAAHIEKYFEGQKIKWDEIAEGRVRAKKTGEIVKYTLTLKGPGLGERTEIEVDISEADYSNVMGLKQIGKIYKTRYEADLGDDLKAEIDIYAGNLKGLVVTEVEYDKEKFDKAEISMRLKEKFGNDIEDVTEDPEYKNKNLARLELSLNDEQ